MHPQQAVCHFVALRARGWSLRRIAGHLNIPKSTLYEWQRLNEQEITAFKTIHLEEAREKLLPPQDDFTRLSAHLADVRRALATRDLTELHTPQLFRLEMELSRRLATFRGPSRKAAELPAVPKRDLDEIFRVDEAAEKPAQPMDQAAIIDAPPEKPDKTRQNPDTAAVTSD